MLVCFFSLREVEQPGSPDCFNQRHVVALLCCLDGFWKELSTPSMQHGFYFVTGFLCQHLVELGFLWRREEEFTAGEHVRMLERRSERCDGGGGDQLWCGAHLLEEIVDH